MTYTWQKYHKQNQKTNMSQSVISFLWTELHKPRKCSEEKLNRKIGKIHEHMIHTGNTNGP